MYSETSSSSLIYVQFSDEQIVIRLMFTTSFSTFAIDNTHNRAFHDVTPRPRTCGCYCGSDVLQCLTNDNSKTTYNWITKIVAIHFA